MKRIGLVGILGLYNYGTEAIVRGTYELINSTNPNTRVIYFTESYQYDRDILKNTRIEVKKYPKNNRFLVRIINKILRVINIDYQFPFWNYKKIICEVDVVFSVGGDLYTIPKDILSNSKEKGYNQMIDFGRFVAKKRNIYIWGASIGPFGNKKEILDYYRLNLSNIDKIYLRETASLDYLRNIGLSSIAFLPDPAFYVNVKKANVIDLVEKKWIGINLSELSFDEVFGEKRENAIKKTILSIENLLMNTTYNILFIPHVFSTFSNKDNDYIFMNNIRDLISTPLKNRVEIIEEGLGFLGTNQALKKCFMLMSARMHLCINGIIGNIPTVFISYSQKSRGMSNFIYKDDQLLVSLEEFPSKISEIVSNVINDYDNILLKIKYNKDEIDIYKLEILKEFNSILK